MSYEIKKNAHLKRHLGAWDWQGVNFHLQEKLDFFDKNSADKIWSKKDKRVESVLPHAI